MNSRSFERLSVSIFKTIICRFINNLRRGVNHGYFLFAGVPFHPGAQAFGYEPQRQHCPARLHDNRRYLQVFIINKHVLTVYPGVIVIDPEFYCRSLQGYGNFPLVKPLYNIDVKKVKTVQPDLKYFYIPANSIVDVGQVSYLLFVNS